MNEDKFGYGVWYRKPEFRNVAPVKRDLLKSHAYVCEVFKASNLEDVFIRMQGEIWSPNGEARSLIQAFGLDHTSMSIGDVVVDPGGNTWVVAVSGFERLP